MKKRLHNQSVPDRQYFASGRVIHREVVVDKHGHATTITLSSKHPVPKKQSDGFVAKLKKLFGINPECGE